MQGELREYESGTQQRLVTSRNTDCLSVNLCLFPNCFSSSTQICDDANLGRCHTATQKILMSKRAVNSSLLGVPKLQ